MPFGSRRTSPNYGIIPILKTSTNLDFALQKSVVHYRVVDVQYHATLQQTYASRGSRDAEVRYVFPLPSDASVCSYRAMIDGERTVIGKVKGKQHAKAEYDQAIRKGQTATLLEQVNEEVFQISLGNIHPGQMIEVHLGFAALISQDRGLDSLRLTFPVAIGPRYGEVPSALRHRSVSGISENVSSGLKVSISLEMASPIRAVESPSHPMSTHIGTAQEPQPDSKAGTAGFDTRKAFVKLTSSEWLASDIIVVINCDGLDRPRCMVETFSPEESAVELTDAYALSFIPRFDLPPLPKQEFIFLIDRSGSMQGGKIAALIASLHIMLKSLPTRDTLFNIISFGSRVSSLWSKAHPYTEQTVDFAEAHIDSIQADYEGTEIRKAVKYTLQSRNEEYKAGERIPTSIFVLTDGESWDLKQTLATVREAVEHSEERGLLRFFTLGIGNASSRAMCEGIARLGKGVSVFVREDEKLDHKLMGLVRAALGAPMENLAMDWGINFSEKALSHDSKKMDVVTDDEDGFEVIDSQPSANKALLSGIASEVLNTREAQETPLSLSDNSCNPVKDIIGAEIGAREIEVFHSVPLQSAPSLETLPSLYPEFRTSIFAIARRSSDNQSGPSKEVKIKGTILGHPVELSIPVTRTLPSTTGDTLPPTKMLHVLSARAIMRELEDSRGEKSQHPSMTAENKAEVKRIALRYGLTSSQTSFVAVDIESGNKKERTLTASRVRRFDLDSQDELDDIDDDLDAIFEMASQLNRLSGRGMRNELDAQSARLASIASKSAALDSGIVRSATARFRKYEGSVPSRPPSSSKSAFGPPATSKSISLPTSNSGEPTIEMFARLQSFDGSFKDAEWLELTVKLPTPAMPPLSIFLNYPHIEPSKKNTVWRTLLCVAYIQKRFATEKVVWEMLVNKALTYAKDTLRGSDVGFQEILREALRRV